MRRLLGVLRSDEEAADRSPQPGLGDLDALAAGVRRTGIAVSCRTEGAPYRVPRALGLSAYRIVQEALTNSVKHAPGSSVEVVVRYGDGVLDLQITDSGGTRSPSPTAGHGLVGMRERAALFGGEVRTAPTPDGYRVTATLPVSDGGSR